MQVEFDSVKDAANVAKHRISLARAADMEIFHYVEDDRYEYGEVRYRAWGAIDGKAYCLVFTNRGTRIRAISLRRAHKTEMDRHVPKTQSR